MHSRRDGGGSIINTGGRYPGGHSRGGGVVHADHHRRHPGGCGCVINAAAGLSTGRGRGCVVNTGHGRGGRAVHAVLSVMVDVVPLSCGIAIVATRCCDHVPLSSCMVVVMGLVTIVVVMVGTYVALLLRYLRLRWVRAHCRIGRARLSDICCVVSRPLIPLPYDYHCHHRVHKSQR